MGLTDDRNDPGLRNIGEDGMQETYLVLSAEERAKGYLRPFNDGYLHERCGSMTYLHPSIAETYAVQPDFYDATYCAKCKAHYPVGADGEFIWHGTDVKVGT